jgi:E3 ubiquitin-protein ligase UBR3
MVEAFLVLLTSVLSLRTNLGLDEETLTRLEMVSLLCMGDKTHSTLYEHMPEKCGTCVPLELFDK